MLSRRLGAGFAVLLFAACSGGNGNGGDDGGTVDSGPTCTPAAEFTCTEHFQCKGQSVCSEDRGSTVCFLADRGGDGKCTFESLAIPGGTNPLESPVVDCYATARTPPAGPALVSLRGCVEAFGLDADTSVGLTIEVFTVAAGTTGAPLATGVSGLDDTVLGKNCPDDGAFDVASETLPTNTPLIVRVTDPLDPPEFVETVEYGVVLWADDAADVGGVQTVEEDATVIAATTYQVFPQTAGISTGIEGSNDLTDGVGRGALAGTLADCNRREIANLSVSIDGMNADRIVDGTGRLVHTDGRDNPDLRRDKTNVDGAYAAINVSPGDRTITVTATIDGAEVELIQKTAPVKADSVTLLSLQGEWP